MNHNSTKNILGDDYFLFPETNELIDINYYSDLPVNKEAIVQVVEMERNLE